VRPASALLIAIAGLAACKAHEDAFYDTVFPCNPNASVDPCGTTRSGRPMTCFGAGQLGGDDFCVEACDPAIGSSDPRLTCLASGALLQLCHPHADADAGAAAGAPALACPSGLLCYRTDLLKDEGVCILAHQLCKEDKDCSDSQTCAGSIIRSLYPSLPLLTDSLQCLQTSCQSPGTPCAPGAVCLANYYDVGPGMDICVPTCDNQQCPPNFSCAYSDAAPGAPKLCLPGVPGSRCANEEDCIVGSCVDTGAGFRECNTTTLCTSDLDCAYLSGAAGMFVCAQGMTGGGRLCVSTRPFNGSNCATAADCAAGLLCSRFSPYVSNQGHGECRSPCDPDGRCSPHGGVKFVCLDNGNSSLDNAVGGCYPSAFGLPCSDSSDCLATLTCQAVSPDAHTFITSPAICTSTCASDVDCSGNPLVRSGGFCRDGLCRISGENGTPCDRNEECGSGYCSFATDGTGHCAA
jgi:hypothetical protein